MPFSARLWTCRLGSQNHLLHIAILLLPEPLHFVSPGGHFCLPGPDLHMNDGRRVNRPQCPGHFFFSSNKPFQACVQ